MFVGRDTLVADAYPMKSGKQFVNTLEDNITRRGAMDKLLSDSAQTEISNKVMDILWAYHISNWHSEPYHKNQNPAEWRYRTIKSWTNTVMNMSGAPANCWLLCLIYVCYLLNHIACSALDGKIPLLALTGKTPDISIILLFTFYQPVFYATYDQHFPSESEERAGYWVGFGEHCGDAMTHNDLLALEGWCRFRSLARKDKVLARAIKQSKIRQVRRSQTYMFGYLIPSNYMEAMQFDSENKNSKWYDAIKLEMESISEYKVFKKWDKAILDKHKKVKNPPKGYHGIKVHLVFAVKFDGRHKARLVADGHLTPEPIENIYSGVVSLRNLRRVIFLGKLNNLELWGADIGNAQLEAFTDEKLYIVACPEFQELEGYILIFLKALYGLKSSGKRWAEVIHGILSDTIPTRNGRELGEIWVSKVGTNF